MKRILCSALALVLALSLCACGESGGDPGPTYPAAFAGLEDQIDAAREEGRLTVCVSGDEPFLTAACEKFEELFGISVTVCTAEPDALPNGSGTDVWYGGDEALCRALSESGGLMAYTPEAASALIDPGYGHEDYCAINSDALGIMVNSDVLARMGISAPRSWDDLLEPVYRELVWLPGYDTTEGRLLAQAAWDAFGDKAEKYLLELDENVAQYTEDGDPATKYVGTGECVVAVGLLSSGAAQRLENSYDDIRLVTPRSGTPYVLNGSAILRGTAHSAAAQLWMEYALSPTCQALAAMNGWYVWPTMENVSLPEDLAQLNVDLDGLTCRLPMGEDAEALDSLIDAVQTALNPPAES